MDVFCIRTQIFLIKILNVQRWIICAYEQVSHRDMDVFCVRTQIFLISGGFRGGALGASAPPAESMVKKS